jgi:hypothetical protein
VDNGDIYVKKVGANRNPDIRVFVVCAWELETGFQPRLGANLPGLGGKHARNGIMAHYGIRTHVAEGVIRIHHEVMPTMAPLWHAGCRGNVEAHLGSVLEGSVECVAICRR